MKLLCPCGGRAWSRDELIELVSPERQEYAGEREGYANMWRSILGPFDLYCPDEDDVLTEEESWVARGLRTRIHDEHDPTETYVLEAPVW